MSTLPPQHTTNDPAPEATTVEEEESAEVATLSSPWEHDVSQPYCANCASEFTNFNRRHHCRLCGKIFCHKCSNQKCLIPPSSIVLVPRGGKKALPADMGQNETISFSPDEDPNRMLTYVSPESQDLLYGKGLEERTKLAREPLRVCSFCYTQLQPVQEELRNSNSNAMRYNAIDPTDPRRLFNSPLAFTLGHEVRKAAYTLNNLLPLPKRMGALQSMSSSNDIMATTASTDDCKDTCSTLTPNLGNLDGVRIPARLLENAQGVAVMTVVKGGFGLAGFEFGTGLVVARRDESQGGGWSAPSAIGTAGISWGALIGAQVSDHVFLLMNEAAVKLMFSNDGSLQLGADVGVALGPVGRSVEADFGASPKSLAPIYTYSLSKGLYAGVSLDGKVIVTRHNVNEKFYGKEVTGEELLMGQVPTPPAAQPLYDALKRCHVYSSGSDGGYAALLKRQQQARLQHQVGYEYGDYPNDSSSLTAEQQPLSSMLLQPPAANDQHSYTLPQKETPRPHEEYNNTPTFADLPPRPY